MHCGIWDPTIYRNIDSYWICFPIGPEDDLIKVETCRPDNTLFLLYIKQSVVLLADTLYLYLVLRKYEIGVIRYPMQYVLLVTYYVLCHST